jgi:lauroyl/myristoyl acyltransferase
VKPSWWIRDLGGLALYGAGAPAIQRLPRRAFLALGSRAGDQVRRISRTDVKLIEDELTRTLGGGLDLRGLIRRAYRGRMVAELEVLRYPALNPDTIDATTAVEGRQHLDRALAGGKGAIVMIGHFGANHMIMPALGHRGVPMNQISASPTAWASIRTDGRANPIWEKVQLRRHALEQALPTQHIDVFGFMRPAYTCLERNEVLGLAFDGGGGTRWVEMPLCDRVAEISTQPWQLARTTGAMIVPTVVVREEGELRHRVVLSEPYAVARSRDKDADVAAAAARFGSWFSEKVRRWPDHYAHFLLLRRRVRHTDARPFFGDYPE